MSQPVTQIRGEVLRRTSSACPPDPRGGTRSRQTWRGDQVRLARGRVTFQRALADYDAAMRRHVELSDAEDRARDEVEAAAPPPAELRNHRGVLYAREEDISDDPRLTFDQKAELVPLFRDWRERRSAAEAAHGYAEAVRALEDDRAWSDAFDRLIDTPAPDAETFAAKMRAYMSQVHCERIWHDIDEVHTISALLSDQMLDGTWPLARLYLDALRLTGARPQLWNSMPFDAGEWLADFEALPGHAMGPHGPSFMEPEAWRDGDMSKPPIGAERWRNLADWQKSLVLSAVITR